DNDVEKAYQRLYNKYVKDDSDAESENGSKDNVEKPAYTSRNEAEQGFPEDSVENRIECPKMLDLSRSRTDLPSTTLGNSPDATPKCSPMMARKREGGPVLLSNQPSSATETDKLDKCEDRGTATNGTSASDKFQKHSKSVEPPPTSMASAATKHQISQRDSPTTNSSEVAELKKSPNSITKNYDGSASETPSRSVSPNIVPVSVSQMPSNRMVSSSFRTHKKTEDGTSPQQSDSCDPGKLCFQPYETM
ncbi:hypothetical protein KIN20_002478, partial [Parelaphostrongylus tenuis]